MELKEALNTLDRIQRKEIAYMHAMGLLSYDGSTGAPEGTAQNRGETLGVLSEAAYALTTGKDTRQTLACLKDHWEELDDVTRRIVERKEKDLAELSRIPVEEYVAYTRLINEADAVWHKAKEQNDYNSFILIRSYLLRNEMPFWFHRRRTLMITSWTSLKKA